MGQLEKRFPIYNRLLKLYPAAYRQKYSRQMLQILADMLDDPDNSKSAVWIRSVVDLPFSAAKQNIIYAGGIMKHETPDYVKRNSFIAAVLISPFFIFIIANSLDRHTLANTPHWKHLYLFLILGLPAIAFVLSLTTFAWWTARRRQSIFKSLFDFRHSWPVTTTAVLAALIVLFIPFHDSGPCVSGNPIHEAQQWHQTWRCIQQR